MRARYSRRHRGSVNRRQYGLAGLLACAACGRRLIGHVGRYRHTDACEPFTAAAPRRVQRDGDDDRPAGAGRVLQGRRVRGGHRSGLRARRGLVDAQGQTPSRWPGDRSPTAAMTWPWRGSPRERDQAALRFAKDRDLGRLEATMARLDAEAAAAVVRPSRIPTAAEARAYLESLPDLWAKTSDAGRHAIAEAVFERIDVLGVTDFTFTLTAHAKARGWDAAFGAGVVRVKKVSLVGARGLGPPVPSRSAVAPSSSGDSGHGWTRRASHDGPAFPPSRARHRPGRPWPAPTSLKGANEPSASGHPGPPAPRMARREAVTRGSCSGRPDRAEPLARPTRSPGGQRDGSAQVVLVPVLRGAARSARVGRRSVDAEDGRAALPDGGQGAGPPARRRPARRRLRVREVARRAGLPRPPRRRPGHRRSRWTWPGSGSPSASRRGRPRSSWAMPWRCRGRTADFSVVGSLNCLKFVPDPAKALGEMHRVLRPDGRLVLTIDKQVGQAGQVGQGRRVRPVAVERGRCAADDGGGRLRRRLRRGPADQARAPVRPWREAGGDPCRGGRRDAGARGGGGMSAPLTRTVARRARRHPIG